MEALSCVLYFLPRLETLQGPVVRTRLPLTSVCVFSPPRGMPLREPFAQHSQKWAWNHGFPLLHPIPIRQHGRCPGVGIFEGSEDDLGGSSVAEGSVGRQRGLHPPSTPPAGWWDEFQCSENEANFSSLLVLVLVSQAQQPQKLVITVGWLKIKAQMKFKMESCQVKNKVHFLIAVWVGS